MRFQDCEPECQYDALGPVWHAAGCANWTPPETEEPSMDVEGGDLIGYCFQTEDGPAVVVGPAATPNYVRIQISTAEGVAYSMRPTALVRRHKLHSEEQ